jgi:cyclase
MKITNNLYVETRFPGANVGYVTTEDGVVMIESPQRPTDALAWRREMESHGTIRYLINTEPHPDHCAGDFFFSGPVVVHEKARDKMLAIDINEIRETVARIDPEGLSLMDNYRVSVPAITFSERLTLYLGRHSFQLIHMPGHSAGQIAVFVPEEKVVFTGDNVTYRSQGFLHEADPFAWLESLKRTGELAADYLVPGHGEVCDRSYLKEEASYIQGCIDAVRKAIEQGWTKDEAVARVSLPSPYPLDEGAESIAGPLMKRGVANLYDRLSK